MLRVESERYRFGPDTLDPPGQVLLREGGPPVAGFRVKSGWAAAVLLDGPVRSPQVLDKRAIELCDPAVPETRQPYHAAAGELERDAAKIERRLARVRAAARRSVAEFLARRTPARAAIVAGSLNDPASIANEHIRAHALEGRLFRTALEDALRAGGVSCSTVLEKQLYPEAAVLLGRPEQDLKRVLAALGRGLEPPWRTDDKLAALAAWTLLV